MTIHREKATLHYPSSASEVAGSRHNQIQKIIFDGTSRLTTAFPRLGARWLNLTFGSILSNPILGDLFNEHNRRVVRRLTSCRRFLVIPDIHIGDAVMTQAAVTALRDFAPEAQVDFVINRAARPLIEGNPETTRILPYFAGGSVPSGAVLAALRNLARSQPYDLCLNFCPYIKDRELTPGGLDVLNIMTQAPLIIANEAHHVQANHFIYRQYRFVHDLLRLVATRKRQEPFRGVRLTFQNSTVHRARAFARSIGLTHEQPVIMLNPDAASPYTRIPFRNQADLLARLARLDALVLIGEGHTEAGIGNRLRETLAPRLRSKTRIIPAALPLEVYAALIDACDVFISGDTGPLHLAAARRYSLSGRLAFRNRTAVLSIFGATPARMSGYDSFQPGYLPSNQDAPSWTYVAGSPCRNITCLNKIFKTCRSVRCFEEFDAAHLAGLVASHLETLRLHDHKPRERAAA